MTEDNQCPYCLAPARTSPQLDDDNGIPMCADCFASGFGIARNMREEIAGNLAYNNPRFLSAEKVEKRTSKTLADRAVPMTDTSNENVPRQRYRIRTARRIAGRTLDEWKQLARQDNCLDLMTPSDLRHILEAIE